MNAAVKCPVCRDMSILCRVRNHFCETNNGEPSPEVKSEIKPVIQFAHRNQTSNTVCSSYSLLISRNAFTV